MHIDIAEDQLLIISDLHLGNPFNARRRELIQFMNYACDNRLNVCINGDGFEIMQATFSQMTEDLPALIGIFRRMQAEGLNLYYVVGNHDIVLERFLAELGFIKFAPFLNVRSGSRRLRIEHGHLYDPFFIALPRLYEALTLTAGLFLQVFPRLYRLWIAFEKVVFGKTRDPGDGLVGERRSFVEAASEILSRGFDVVIFGHTHHPGVIEIGDGKQYVNTGSWMVSLSYVRLSHGRVTLDFWPERA